MYIHLKVVPDAKKEVFEYVKPLHFKTCVREPAKHNRANDRVRELVATHFGIHVQDVRIVSGHHSPSKIMSIPDPMKTTSKELY